MLFKVLPFFLDSDVTKRAMNQDERDFQHTIQATNPSTAIKNGAAYSMEIRSRVCAKIAEGQPWQDIAKNMNVSPSFVLGMKRRMRRENVTDDGKVLVVPAPLPRGGAMRDPILDADKLQQIADIAVRMPERTQEQIAEDLNARHPGLNASRSTIGRALRDLKPSLEIASRVSKPASRAEREFVVRQLASGRVDVFSLLFVGETHHALSTTATTFAAVMLRRPGDDIGDARFENHMREHGVLLSPQRGLLLAWAALPCKGGDPLALVLQYLRRCSAPKADSAMVDREHALRMLRTYARLSETEAKVAEWERDISRAERSAQSVEGWASFLRDLPPDSLHLRRALARLPVTVSRRQGDADADAAFRKKVEWELGAKATLFTPAKATSCYDITTPLFALVATHAQTLRKQQPSQSSPSPTDRSFAMVQAAHVAKWLQVGCYHRWFAVPTRDDVQYVGDGVGFGADGGLEMADLRCARIYNDNASKHFRCVRVPLGREAEPPTSTWLPYTPGYETPGSDAAYIRAACGDDESLFFVEEHPPAAEAQRLLSGHGGAQRVDTVLRLLRTEPTHVYLHSHCTRVETLEKLSATENEALRVSDDRVATLAGMYESKGKFALHMQSKRFRSVRHMAAAKLAERGIVGDALPSLFEFGDADSISRKVAAMDVRTVLREWRDARLHAVLLQSHAVLLAEALTGADGSGMRAALAATDSDAPPLRTLWRDRRQNLAPFEGDEAHPEFAVHAAIASLERCVRDRFPSFEREVQNVIVQSQSGAVDAVSRRQASMLVQFALEAARQVEIALDASEHSLVAAAHAERVWTDPADGFGSLRHRVARALVPQRTSRVVHWVGRQFNDVAPPPDRSDAGGSTDVVAAWSQVEFGRARGIGRAKEVSNGDANALIVQFANGRVAVASDPGNEHVKAALARRNPVSTKNVVVSEEVVFGDDVVVSAGKELPDACVYMDLHTKKVRAATPFPPGSFLICVAVFFAGRFFEAVVTLGDGRRATLWSRRVREDECLAPTVTFKQEPEDTPRLVETLAPLSRSLGPYLTLHRPMHLRVIWLEKGAFAAFDVRAAVRTPPTTHFAIENDGRRTSSRGSGPLQAYMCLGKHRWFALVGALVGSDADPVTIWNSPDRSIEFTINARRVSRPRLSAYLADDSGNAFF